MGEIRIGTCSWTDPTLLKSGWYPEGIKSPEQRLQHYASLFDIAEVDSSYYALPGEGVTRLWVERTPDGFTFDVKAFRLFTQHPTPVKSLPRDIQVALSAPAREKANVYSRDLPQELTLELWARFESALLPLDSAGKLGAVLFQFPPWYAPSRENYEYIARLKERLPQYRIAVEFRGRAWLEERRWDDVLSLLREHEYSFVCVDEPQGMASSVPPIAAATSDLALVRFHGRNRENWEKRDITATDRFDYLYTREELKEWVPRIKGLSDETKAVHVLFNNHKQDYAPRNARDMQLLLNLA